MKERKLYVGQRVTARTRDGAYRHGKVLWLDTSEDEKTLWGVCVEFDEPVNCGHNGNDFRFEGRNGHCWWVSECRAEPTPTLRVSVLPDGGGVVVKGAATEGKSQVNNDAFDYAVGSFIAVARALDRDPAEVCRKTLSVLPEAESGPVPTSGDDAQVEKTPTAPDTPGADAEKPVRFPTVMREFMTLHMNHTIRGIGKKTKYHDTDGKLLVTGDLVRAYRDGKPCFEPIVFVLEDEDGPYIDGIKRACDPKTGKISDEFVVEKIRRYCDVPDGETHNFAVMRR